MNKKGTIHFKGQLKLYMQWPVVMTILLIAMNIWIYMVDQSAGFLMSIFVIIYAIIAFILYVNNRSLIFAELVEFATQYSGVQDILLRELAIPYAILMDDGKILWGNSQFAEAIGPGFRPDTYLSKYIPELNRSVFPKEEKEGQRLEVSYMGRDYSVDLCKVPVTGFSQKEPVLEIPEGKEYFITLYMNDVTDLNQAVAEVEDQKLVAGLIYIDNYDEVIESVEEVRQSLLIALIDRKINQYVARMDGIVKKLEKDRYFIIVKNFYFHKMEEDHFSILDDVKEISVGNKIPATLSIGLGFSEETYGQSYDYARVAIDLALARGGDQAVDQRILIRSYYYGGKAQQMEKTTRVKARVKAHALKELMDNKDRLLIMGHRMADIDAFGAAVGIYRIAMSMNKKANIVLNDVTSSVRPMMERFQNNPEYPDDMFLKGAKAAELVDAGTMLVVVDVNRPSITDEPNLLRLIRTIVVLDHHRTSSEVIDNAVLSYVEPYASSACEMVAEVLQYIADGIKVRPCEADAMYAGIVIDTQNFTNQTGVRTFEAAAFLRRSGADVTRVRKLFRENMVDYQAKAEAVRAAEVYMDAFAISVCPAEGLDSPTIIGAQAANELLEIKGIKASVVLTDYNNTIYFSARSIDEVNVQVMMEKLGGGGHRTIAGAQMQGITVEEAKERLKAVIRQMMDEGDVS